jgi:hypothetical protein
MRTPIGMRMRNEMDIRRAWSLTIFSYSESGIDDIVGQRKGKVWWEKRKGWEAVHVQSWSAYVYYWAVIQSKDQPTWW